MTAALWLWAAVVLLGTMVAGLARVARGPTAADRMLAALLFGSTGIVFVDGAQQEGKAGKARATAA
jgi:multicomponent Na+:H+ antiporter subunit F